MNSVSIQRDHALRQQVIGYGFALAAVAIATPLRLALTPLLGSALPFITHFAASLILAWYCGFWPAAFGVVVSAIAGSYFILPGLTTGGALFGRNEFAVVTGFVMASLAVSFLIDLERKISFRARKAEADQAFIAADNARLLQQAQRSEEELLLINEELRRANRDLEAFAYSASHDLKEPLRTIATSAEWIERRLGSQLNAPDTDFLARIRAEARRMESLIEDLLLYSQATKIEQGPPVRVDAARVLGRVVESLGGQIEASGAIVTQGFLPAVAIHESSLARLFQNLISNGIKYRGQEPPRIHIAGEERGGQWVFVVSDNGIGMEPQFGDQIFGLFKRLHSRDEYPGSGVGLAICKRVVEQYGGRIWLEKSAPGAGSTFCFSVPQQRNAGGASV